jgi:hypothetical protein
MAREKCLFFAFSVLLVACFRLLPSFAYFSLCFGLLSVECFSCLTILAVLMVITSEAGLICHLCQSLLKFVPCACYRPDNTLHFCFVGHQVNSTLTELNLWNNGIGADGAEHIAEAVKVGWFSCLSHIIAVLLVITPITPSIFAFS